MISAENMVPNKVEDISSESLIADVNDNIKGAIGVKRKPTDHRLSYHRNALFKFFININAAKFIVRLTLYMPLGCCFLYCVCTRIHGWVTHRFLVAHIRLDLLKFL